MPPLEANFSENQVARPVAYQIMRTRLTSRDITSSFMKGLDARSYLTRPACIKFPAPARSKSAILTSSAREPACILRMILARCTLAVALLIPILAAICLFVRPAVTKPITCFSRGVSDSKRAFKAAKSSLPRAALGLCLRLPGRPLVNLGLETAWSETRRRQASWPERSSGYRRAQ